MDTHTHIYMYIYIYVFSLNVVPPSHVITIVVTVSCGTRGTSSDPTEPVKSVVFGDGAAAVVGEGL